jgi:Mg2+ and Co2+ transporter CorA
VLNKELRQLQHLFASYEKMIGRVLAEKSIPIDPASTAPLDGAVEQLSKKARDRFERLRDQLESLMLATIQDYLDEKDSLQNTVIPPLLHTTRQSSSGELTAFGTQYFQLLQQKDSRATAKLTRNANLLAKAGVVFLPVTLMTSYFSIQIPHLMDDYTLATYWGSFAVVLGISLITLLFFAKLLMIVGEYFDRLSDDAFRKAARLVWKKKQKHEEAKIKAS